MTAGPAAGGGHLVVIDMQRVFADPDSPWGTPGFGGIVPSTAKLISTFGSEVTFTRFVAPATPAGAWRAYYAEWAFALQPPDAPLWDVVADLGPVEAPTVDATTFSKWGPELAARVGDRTMVLAGVSTDCCVLSTALAAADAGIPVQVVRDACAGVDEDSHEKALHVMGLYAPLVTVVHSTDLVRG